MKINIGQHLGDFEVSAVLGKGGMGEVWRAVDSRLGREVALKVLPDDFADDGERHARFEREAKTLASVNNLNIATLYGLEHIDGQHVLVMELVEGPGLDEIIARGPVPIDEAVSIALQIAEGLEAAHEAGIVHRDLKPANIKLRPDGTVKVLDFGLAKAWETDGGDSSLSLSPTITANTTAAGVILGTAAYMAPEQAAGTAADRRADIWAFGVVLWEMLTGQKLFNGETVSHVLAAVLKDEVALGELPPAAPPYLKKLIGRCLQKNRKQRLQAIGDARIAIQEGQEGEPAAAAVEGQPRRSSRLVWVSAAAAGVVAAALGLLVWSGRGEEIPVVRATIPPPPGTVFHLDPLNPGAATLAPDGSKIVFSARSAERNFMLYVRAINQSEAHALANTEGGHYPFWSPNGEWIGFMADSKLKKIKASGGPALTICDAPDGKGGTWNDDGVIVFGPDSDTPLHLVAAGGGESTPITELDLEAGDNSHRLPRFLPGGQYLTYFARNSAGDSQSTVRIIGLEEGGTGRDLLVSNATASFAAGHLLFMRDRMLMAQPFDLKAAEFDGDPFPLAEDVIVRALTGAGVFSATDNGVLVYQTGGREVGRRLHWFDRNDISTGQIGDEAVYEHVVLSPDGSTAAVVILDTLTGKEDIWLVDLESGLRSRFTFDKANDSYPVWSPDGKSLVFASRRSGTRAIYRKPVAGLGDVALLYSADVDIFPNSWSPDGRFIAFNQPGQELDPDLWILDLEGGPSAELFYQTETAGAAARFSPDGRWLAYWSQESGRGEVYVTPFPGPGRRWQVSRNSGTWFEWRADGREIFFQEENGPLKSVSVDGRGASFSIGAEELRMTLGISTDSGAKFSVAPDGQKILAVINSKDAHSTALNLVVGWTRELE